MSKELFAQASGLLFLNKCLSVARLGLSQLILILSLKFTLQSADV